MNKPIDNDVRFKLLRLLSVQSNLSQREIARELNVSLGSTNYILRALVDKGQVKIRNFRASGNKRRYVYILTPRGLEDKARLTAGFLKRKRAEYDALRTEIEALQAEVELVAGAARRPGVK